MMNAGLEISGDSGMNRPIRIGIG